MSSIKQLIVNAIIKVSGENPTLNREGEPSAEEARDAFIKALLAELFPEDPAVPAATPKKTKKSKKTPEPAPEAAPATEAPTESVAEVPVEAPKKTASAKKTKKTGEVVPVVVEKVDAEPAAEPAAETPSKKKRAPMTEEAKAAMKAKREATLAAKKAAAEAAAAGAGGQPELEEGEIIPTPPKKEKKEKKVKPAEDANLAKIDPTWRKHLKHADKDHAKELEPELLKFLNALSKEDFNAKKAEEHVADFVASRKPAAAEDDGKVEADLIVVDFNGKEYFVNPETKRVYEGEGVCDAEGNWTNYKGVGYVGMAAFAEMKLEDE
jgi:chemotaxis protein histidine kinase CheA